jgi:protein ImuB
VPFAAAARQPGALAARRGEGAAPASGEARTRRVGDEARLEEGAVQRPTRLLSEPRLLVATGEGGRVSAIRLGAEVHAVLSFEGPERLRGEWWSAPFDRDYYRARVEGLGDCWIYRDGADGRLHLHGFFD